MEEVGELNAGMSNLDIEKSLQSDLEKKLEHVIRQNFNMNVYAMHNHF